MLMALALPATTQTLLDCAREPDDARRLACFDRQVGRPAAGPAAPTAAAPAATSPAAAAPVSAPAAAAPVAAPASADTFGLPSASRDRREPLVARVVSVERQPRGGLQITLDNDQVWLQSDSAPVVIKPGSTVKIQRKLLGAYWLQINSSQGTTVRRVR